MKRQAPFSLSAAGFALASLILAYEPLCWLIGSWIDPSYASTGAVYLFAIAALLVWSLTSSAERSSCHSSTLAVLLLATSALMRLAAQVLAVNVIGGVALALDVFALATLLRTGERKRPVSPFWLSVLFLFTLPVERIVQRLLGYPLQEVSAKLSCAGLGLVFPDLSCSGIRIELSGRDVLVDLPCSGTSGLMLALAFTVILSAVYRPRFSTATLWIFLTLVFGILGNALRIGLIAIGLAHPDYAFGADVMAEPVHSLIGYLTLFFSLLPVLVFYRPNSARKRLEVRYLSFRQVSRRDRNMAALVFVSLALIIVTLPRQALDVSSAAEPAPLPLSLAGEAGVKEELLPIEERYFRQFGGHARKRRYGPMALTLVQTTSPLRHLHAPDDCLRGLGYDVDFLGTRFTPVPTALYRARAKTGEAWQVAVTFVSDRGDVTHNIAEAIWLWLRMPGTSWTSIQRITPWSLAEHDRTAFEAATLAALDLSPNPAPEGEIR
ncbi:exosortase T [Roseibium sp.]|uniref:exosortase T n=1 Tax=Roseibium sp. TaxID=1936156 RepID=UPI003D0EA2AB